MAKGTKILFVLLLSALVLGMCLVVTFGGVAAQQYKVYALVQLPDACAEERLETIVDVVCDDMDDGTASYATIGGTQEQLDNLKASGYIVIVIEQRNGNKDTYLTQLFQTRDRLVPPKVGYHPHGAPDTFVYYFIDSDETGVSMCHWTETNETGPRAPPRG